MNKCVIFFFIIVNGLLLVAACGKKEKIELNRTSVTVIQENKGDIDIDIQVVDDIDFNIVLPDIPNLKVVLKAKGCNEYEFLGWVDLENDKEIGIDPNLILENKYGKIRAHFRKRPKEIMGENLLAAVGKETTLGFYEPDDLELIDTEQQEYKGKKLRKEAAIALRKLLEAARKDGVLFKVKSAYRSYKTQERIFNRYKTIYGVLNSEKFSARPGQSEHQLGTALDFGGTQFDFTDEFENTLQGEWLLQNAFLYGFVLSYPQDSEKKTGYIYEPWHYRYIGIEQAKEWKLSGLTLIEYLSQLDKQYTNDRLNK